MGKGAKHSSYAFDQFRLDADTMMLYREGQPVTLPRRVVKTLAVLVENRGSIVSKEDLIKQVWEDSIVEESNLSQNLYLLRKTLGKRPDGSGYIETLRRRGYRFTSEDVAVEDPSPEVVTIPDAAGGARYAVERRGNVFALVDWKEAEPEAAVDEPQVVSILDETQRESNTKTWIIAGAAALIVVVAIGLAIWFNSTRTAPVVDDVPPGLEIVPLTNGEYVVEATISVDGKYFTYHEEDGDYARIMVQQTGQGKPIEVVPKAKRVVAAKAFSPDSQFVYYISTEGDADHSSLYRVPTLGGVQTKIAEYAVSYPTFSPDGKWIAYVKTNPVYSIVVAASDGSGERTLLTAEPPAFFAANPAWSPDGKSIVFGHLGTSDAAKGKCTITSLNVEDGSLRPLSPEQWDTCYRIEWRRDGKGIYFIGTKLAEAATIRRDQVYYMAAADGTAHRLTSDPSRKQANSLGVTERNEVLAVPFTRSSQIWVMDAKGGETATRLTNGAADGRAGLVPLKDGRIAFITRVGENLGIWTVDAKGEDRRQILADPPLIEELRATPDGKYFFFAHEKENLMHLYRVDADGSNIKQITSGESLQTDSTTSPDGKWIAFDSADTPGGPQRIWRTSIEGGEPTKISDQLCGVPYYSPSGRFISCVWGSDLFILSADDGRVVHTFHGAPIPLLNIGARWTPDEKALVYISSQKGTTNIWLQPVDGKPPRQLTDFPGGDIYNFAYSHDGSKLYLARGFQVRDAILIKNVQ